MTEIEACISRLTDKDAAAACAYADALRAESRESDRWYQYLENFVPLLEHKNSLVRNRAIYIIAANARWDTEDKFDRIIDSVLKHVTDEKPITARQVIQSLPEIGRAKPALIPRILERLQNADLTGYRDSMQPLLIKDIMAAQAELKSEGSL